MHRGLTVREQDAVHPALERIRIFLPHLRIDASSAVYERHFEEIRNAILQSEWVEARKVLTLCAALLSEQKQEARGRGECALADRLLKDALVLGAKERLCLLVDEWDRGHFGNAWEVLVRAHIDVSAVARNGGGRVAARWEHLMAECEQRFPPIVGFSIGGEVVSARCSICGQDVLSCSHVTGRIYCGVLCCREIKQMDLHETSIVKDPAQPACRALKWGRTEVRDEGLFWDEGEGI